LGLIALLTVFAVTRVPSALSASIAFERGQRDERAGQHDQASAEYAKVVERFPESTLAVARLGISQYRAGNLSAAAETFSKLAGRKASTDLTSEVNAIIEDMNRRTNR
jgi:TolA-binding protein